MQYKETVKFLLLLNRLPPEIQKAVVVALKKFQRNPRSVNFKKLFGRVYSIRVTEGDEAFRIIGRVIGKTAHWDFIGNHDAYIAKLEELRRGRLPEALNRPLDKRRKVTWAIAGKLMDPPDADGEVFWVVELGCTGNFKGYYNPNVQFIAGTKSYAVDPADKEPPVLPFYRYTLEVYFKSATTHLGFKPQNLHLGVVRVIDAEGRHFVENK